MRPSKSDQLIRDFVEQIERGTLRAGTRLPTHRDLARQKRVSLSVVNSVYGELARRGLIAAGGRRGTVVTGAPSVAAALRQGVAPAAADVIDLSHNYILSRTLDEAMKALFAAAVRDHWEQSRLASHESLVNQVGQRWLAMLGIDPARSAVFGCGGGQHGILASLVAFVGAGGRIAAEPFTYTGLKLAAAVLGIDIVRVDADEDGMIPASLERAAKGGGVSAVYLMPSFHNPLGTTMPPDRRAALAEVCARHALMVIEDDPHRCFATEEAPSFRELLPERAVHVTTMSKVLGPGIRLGFVAADPGQGMRLQSAIRAASWTIPGVETLVVASALESVLPKVVATLKAEAERRQTTARDILDGHATIGSRNAPHLCLVLERDWTSPQLAAIAAGHGLKVSPGASYAVDKVDRDFVRVSLMGEMDEARVTAGLRLLNGLASAPPATFLSGA